MKQFVFFLCLLNCVIAKEEVPYDEIVFGGEPSGLIEGSVDAITGNYVVSQVDWVVQGAEPISIQRRYLSGKAETVWSGWEFFFKHLKAKRKIVGEVDKIYPTCGDTEHVNFYVYDLEVPEKFGFSLHYEITALPDVPSGGTYKIRGDYPHALTNCYSGEVGARYAAFSNRVFTDPNDSSSILVHGGDGSIRSYKSFKRDKEDYYLMWERLPNGNKIHYQWNSIHHVWRLTRVVTTNENQSQAYAWMDIYYDMDGSKFLKEIRITTSDHQTLRYKFSNKNGGTFLYWTLEGVENSGKPNQYYDYWGNKKTKYFVSDCFMPDERRLRVHYYIPGNNPMPRGNQHLKKHDKREMRVKHLCYPLNGSGQLEETYRFYHHPGEYREKEGTTTVVDCYGNATDYFYNENFLLTRVQYQNPDGSLFAFQVFGWKEYDPNKGHWLHSKTLHDGSGSFVRQNVYHYDANGNVVIEDLVGDFSGQGNSRECFRIHKKYNHQHLLTEEKYYNGKSVEYSYYPNSNRLEKKLILDNGTIKIREFFLYQDAILVKKITDDGKGYDLDDLTDVTKRFFTEYFPKKEGEFLGLPEIIEKKCFDFEEKREKSLQKQYISQYNPFGKPEKVIHYDSNGIKRFILNYAYDSHGRLISETDSMGRIKKYQYDANDNLVIHDNPENAFEEHYGYDLSNRLTSEGQSDRISCFQYNSVGYKVCDINPRGGVTHYAPDPFGHPLTTDKPSVKDQNGAITRPSVNRVYNSLGRIFKETDSEGNTTHIQYTCRGKPSHITHPDGSEEFYRYDLFGEVTAHIAPDRTQTVYHRDFLGRITIKEISKSTGELLLRERFVYDAFHLVKKIAADGVITEYFYDAAGRKSKEVTLGRTICYHYDSFGREEVVIHNNERFFWKKYDLLNRVLEEKEEDQNRKLFAITKYTYDDHSNKVATTKEVQVGESIERTDYDVFKRPVKRVDPLGNTITIEYNDYFVNDLRQKVLKKTTTNPNGIKTIEIFDALERLVTLEKISSEGDFLLREGFFYDLNGNRTKQMSTLNIDEKKITKEWKYDSRGRIIALIEAPGDDLEKVTWYSYDLNGNKIKVIKPDGVVISYQYDGLGRQTEIKTSDGTCHYSLVYDAMGNITQSIDHVTNQVTYRTYNHFGELLHETLGNGLKIHNYYDPQGRRMLIKLQDQSEICFGYDSYHLRNVSRKNSNEEVLYEHFYEDYDLSHHLTQEIGIGNIGEVNHSIDLNGRRVHTSSVYSRETIPSIDPNGNVLEYFRETKGDTEQTTYSYDYLNQLTGETGQFEHSYAYDSHHNRVQKDEQPYFTDSLHQLESTSGASYKHDLNGNCIETYKKSHQIFYSYDGLDRLIQIRSGDKAIRFSYDSWGRCLSRKHLILQKGEWYYYPPVLYLYDGQNELGAYPNELRILGQGYGAEIGATIAIEKNGSVYVPIHDLYGNIIALLDSDGNTLEQYRFSAFGEEIIPQNPMTSWRFQSKRKVAHLVNFGRRFYDPETGRWLSPDPKGFSEGPNLYQYLLNSPQLHFDLYGEAVHKFREIEQMKECLTFDLDFEKRCGGLKSRNWSYYPSRDYSEVANHPLIKGEKEIGYIGGINNTFEEHRSNVKLLSKYAGDMPVHSTYNATHGIVNDLREAQMGLNLVTTTPAVLSFERKLNFFAKASDSSVYFQVAHSQGMIHEVTSQLMMPKEYRDRTVYLGIAPAAYMPSKLCRNAFHYESMRDVVPHLQKVVGIISNQVSNVSVLKPHPQAPMFDHGFSSPTFAEEIKRGVHRYIRGDYD